MKNLREEINDFSEEVSTIINLHQLSDVRSELGFESEEIFDEYEKLRDIELKATLLTAHLAGNHLSPNGYVCFSSSVESMREVP